MVGYSYSGASNRSNGTWLDVDVFQAGFLGQFEKPYKQANSHRNRVFFDVYSYNTLPV